ncbi:MAG: hypothetical protein ABSE49_27360 [Polyangiaceae bacterium]|jgi:hypothetical protein
MKSFPRIIAPLAIAFVASTFVPAVAMAGGAEPVKAHDTWIEKAGTAVFHFFGLDALSFGGDTKLPQRPTDSK